MIKKRCIKLAAILLLAGLVFALPSAALATSVDRLALCNLEGYAGETVEAQITLEGTEAEARDGFWYTHYKQMDGDDARMDITSWVTIEPEEYAIEQGQSIIFTVRVKIPEGATPGLWGATSVEAGQPGHSAERRTYLIFKDTPTGGNVYSGLLIPVSVKVLEEAPPEEESTPPPQEELLPPAPPEQPDTQSPVLNYIKDNVIVVVFGAIIIILLILLLVRMGARKTR